MADSAMPKAVKKSGSGVSSRDVRKWVRRALWAAGIMLLVMIVVLLLLGSAVRADTACSTCHSMAPYVVENAESTHASVTCSDCHSTPGVAGVMIDGLRAMSWMGGSVVEPSAYDDTPCLECHANMLDETVEARGIRVRHSDFIDMPCTQCHGGTGHDVGGRYYRTVEMDDCMQCHRSSVANLDTCEQCHVPDADVERREGNTTWRVTHGAGWEQTHGMGDLRTCTACHEPAYCVECHGTRVPHAPDWVVQHGEGLGTDVSDSCGTCHDSAWCTGCHQVEMPHRDGFLPDHGPEAEEMGEDACYRCHDARYCSECHLQSSHPNVPGVGMGHGG